MHDAFTSSALQELGPWIRASGEIGLCATLLTPGSMAPLGDAGASGKKELFRRVECSGISESIMSSAKDTRRYEPRVHSI